jgi:hypothetical protein
MSINTEKTSKVFYYFVHGALVFVLSALVFDLVMVGLLFTNNEGTAKKIVSFMSKLGY